MKQTLAVLLGIALLLAGCGRRKHVKLAPPPTVQPQVGQTEEGIASWYGHPYHGRQAADGEIYDMETMVAAHRTLPFNTWVRVYNLDNEKTVDVRIIDRGPFIDGRIIDLSHAAAQKVAMIGPGTAHVRVVILQLPSTVAAGHYAVQVGAFRDKGHAERVRREMASRYGAAQLVTRADTPSLWRVLVGDEANEADAGALAERIRKDGGARMAAFVVRL
jgi:rare lipoprotein A